MLQPPIQPRYFHSCIRTKHFSPTAIPAPTRYAPMPYAQKPAYSIMQFYSPHALFNSLPAPRHHPPALPRSIAILAAPKSQRYPIRPYNNPASASAHPLLYRCATDPNYSRRSTILWIRSRRSDNYPTQEEKARSRLPSKSKAQLSGQERVKSAMSQHADEMWPRLDQPRINHKGRRSSAKDIASMWPRLTSRGRERRVALYVFRLGTSTWTCH